MSPDIIMTIIMLALTVIYQNKWVVKCIKDESYILYPLVIPSIVMCLMLLAAPFNWPYDYYRLLRVVIFIGGICNIITLYKIERYSAIPLFIMLSILFNPVIPINLTKNTWMYIDVITVVFIVWSTYYSFGLSTKIDDEEIAENKEDDIK